MLTAESGTKDGSTHQPWNALQRLTQWAYRGRTCLRYADTSCRCLDPCSAASVAAEREPVSIKVAKTTDDCSNIRWHLLHQWGIDGIECTRFWRRCSHQLMISPSLTGSSEAKCGTSFSITTGYWLCFKYGCYPQVELTFVNLALEMISPSTVFSDCKLCVLPRCAFRVKKRFDPSLWCWSKRLNV
jgi:hypothetical protein